MLNDPEHQLELFDVSPHSSSQRHRETLGRLLVNLRHDHLALACIGTLLMLTVIFACGVERGKHLAKAEHAWDAQDVQQVLNKTSTARQTRTAESTTQTAETTPGVSAATIPMSAPSTASVVTAPAASKEPKNVQKSTPSGGKTAPRSRYAVQVRTYNEPQLARMELQRLQARGESAFLIMREGRTFVYVGPFPTKTGASEKVSTLKTHYQDCFVKSL